MVSSRFGERQIRRTYLVFWQVGSANLLGKKPSRFAESDVRRTCLKPPCLNCMWACPQEQPSLGQLFATQKKCCAFEYPMKGLQNGFNANCFVGFPKSHHVLPQATHLLKVQQAPNLIQLYMAASDSWQLFHALFCASIWPSCSNPNTRAWLT